MTDKEQEDKITITLERRNWQIIRDALHYYYWDCHKPTSDGTSKHSKNLFSDIGELSGYILAHLERNT